MRVVSRLREFDPYSAWYADTNYDGTEEILTYSHDGVTPPPTIQQQLMTTSVAIKATKVKRQPWRRRLDCHVITWYSRKRTIYLVPWPVVSVVFLTPDLCTSHRSWKIVNMSCTGESRRSSGGKKKHSPPLLRHPRTKTNNHPSPSPDVCRLPG